MKNRTIYAIGILAAVLTITTVPTLALARGGGGDQGNSNRSAGKGMSQDQNSWQNQNKQQNKQQRQYRYQHEVGSATDSPANRTNRGNGVQERTRSQLRDPATHSDEVAE